MKPEDNIDSEQQEEYLAPIFKSLIQQGCSNSIFEALYFDAGINLYFKFLPQELKNNENFLKKCLAKDLLYLDEIPDNLRNSNFITYDEYIRLVEINKAQLSDNLYPQNKNMLLKLLPNLNDWTIRESINSTFYDDVEIVQAILKRHNGLSLIPKDKANILLEDEQSFKELISLNSEYYSLLPEEKKSTSEYLLLILKDFNGLNLAKDYLCKNRDIEVALKAVEISPNIAKRLNQKLWSAIKRHNAKDNPYEFLKTYSEKEHMENMLINDDINSPKKMKI
jgi:hypothetical protein